MPERFTRAILTRLLKLLFRVDVRGLEHFHAAGGHTVIIANHQSFLDPLLLAVFLPEKPAFVMNVFQARKWYFKPLLKLVKVFKIDPSQPLSTKSVIQEVRAGGRAVIFPEGRITTTGGIMKIYDGTGLIVEKADATVLPVHIEGAQFTYLSLMGGKLKRRLLPKITLTFGAPQKLALPQHLQGKARRRAAAQWIYDVMTANAYHARFTPQPTLAAIIAAGERYGMGMRIAEDLGRQAVSYRGLLMRVLVLARILKGQLGREKHVAVLLPTSLGGLVTFLALHRRGRIPAMLNFSAGIRNVKAAVAMAEAKTVLTSRAFIAKGKLQPLIDALEAEECRILYLEDARRQAGALDKLIGLIGSYVPNLAFARAMRQDASAPAVILYTSGSEGLPKGVALSHANILANIHQAASRISFTNRDVMLNALPIFHSFGLTIGTLLPLTLGIRVFLYPSPLHYKIVPEIAYDVNASILLGTDTFFRGYATQAHGFDFQNVRLAVAGAEKLKVETRELWASKFRVHILEGYGVTETAPALAFNTPLEHKAGTVGRPFPFVECRLEPVEGIAEGGRLLVKGPNVMLGYMRLEHPGVIEPAPEWYDTGDIVSIDQEGYIRILGRAKRFAKIGGEMVSLGMVEELAARHWPGVNHAALAIADERKGEQVVLFTESQEMTREALLEKAKQEKFPELAMPKQVVRLEAIPLLGSGKVDYMQLKEMAV